MTNNPILDELHAVRERLLAEAGGTLDALVDRLQAEEQKSTRPRYAAGATASAAPLKSSEMPAEDSSAAVEP